VNLRRRDFIALVSLSAAGVPELRGAYVPQALSQSEYSILDDMAEALLPRDETGPGGREAHVAYYLDIVLKHSPPTKVESWKRGLNRIQILATEQFQKAFTECTEQQRLALITEAARNESKPESELDHFFVEFKRAAIEAFYASDLIQREHLGYRGNTAVNKFVGCTHTDFDHPGI
jgi:hypothetical protein